MTGPACEVVFLLRCGPASGSGGQAPDAPGTRWAHEPEQYVGTGFPESASGGRTRVDWMSGGPQ
jgi:hypothetical protein